ncbi:MAG: hypothetical protein ACFFFH_14190 [Candidatus Thorarchaeota archaeon]
MYKCLFNRVKNDLYNFDNTDLASYIIMAKKIVENHERNLISRASSTDRNTLNKVGNNDE